MEVCCDLLVDVNGEETFMVDKKILSLYSGRLRKLFGKSEVSSSPIKLILHDFPGGADIFELISRFCYQNGTTEITPSNLLILHFAAQFMEMNRSVSGASNLLEQTEKHLQDLSYCTWTDLLIALKQCQDFGLVDHPQAISEKYVDALVWRLVSASEASPCPSTSSADSSVFRLSCHTKSTESLKTNASKATWWFEELLVLSPALIEMVAKSMISQKFDHVTISKFLLYYQKSKFYSATTDEKSRIVEMVINTHYSLDHDAVSCKNLFGILRITLGLNVSKCSRNKLEKLIGLHLDQASLDNLLVPSPFGINYLYDVNLVLRLLKAYLQKGLSLVDPLQLKKVSSLIDSYIAEIAPDPCLKPSKFLALATALPDCARDSYDELYYAMDMYLEVHSGVSEDEKVKLYCGLNYDKLSVETRVHLSKNTKFPSKSTVQSFIPQHVKLKNILIGTGNSNSVIDSSRSSNDIRNTGNEKRGKEVVVLYSGKFDLSADNEKLKAHLQGMQWRVMELEKVCRKMQSQMTKMMKSKTSSHSRSKSLPKLCS